MSSGTRLPLAHAERVARAIVGELAPACERIEIAGSIRRKKPDVGDIELVLVPRMVDGAPDLLGAVTERTSALEPVLARLAAEGRLVDHPEKREADGDKYKRRWAAKLGIQVDLFLVTPPAEWGPLFTIRTGSAAYSQRLVTALHARGRRCVAGAVRERLGHGAVVPCPEEVDFFRACGVPMLPPERRTV